MERLAGRLNLIHKPQRTNDEREQTQVIQGCARGALTGEIAFPEIVGRLARIGMERYHADYSRQEITYYLANGDSRYRHASSVHVMATEF